MENSLEVDLTKELTAPSQPVLEPEVENTQVCGNFKTLAFSIFKHQPFLLPLLKTKLIFRLVLLHLKNGGQHQHDASRRNGAKLPRLQLGAVYVIEACNQFIACNLIYTISLLTSSLTNKIEKYGSLSCSSEIFLSSRT